MRMRLSLLDVYKRQALMGVRNKHEADENCSATSWELTADEIAMLNEAVAEYERETPKEGSPTKR